jgi:hypothetical protein
MEIASYSARHHRRTYSILAIARRHPLLFRHLVGGAK